MAQIYGVYRHKKSGGVYRVIKRALLQTTHREGLQDDSVMVIYENSITGNCFAREESEFDDGRFEAVT